MERTGQPHQKFRNRRWENRATPAFANGTLRDELIVLRATSAGLREGGGAGMRPVTTGWLISSPRSFSELSTLSKAHSAVYQMTGPETHKASRATY